MAVVISPPPRAVIPQAVGGARGLKGRMAAGAVLAGAAAVAGSAGPAGSAGSGRGKTLRVTVPAGVQGGMQLAVPDPDTGVQHVVVVPQGGRHSYATAPSLTLLARLAVALARLPLPIPNFLPGPIPGDALRFAVQTPLPAPPQQRCRPALPDTLPDFFSRPAACNLSDSGQHL